MLVLGVWYWGRGWHTEVHIMRLWHRSEDTEIEEGMDTKGYDIGVEELRDRVINGN